MRLGSCILRAIDRDRAEIVVMPGPGRLLKALMDLFPSLGPAMNRLSGGDKLIAAYTKEVAVRKARQFAKSKGWSYSEKVDPQTQQTIITLRKY